MWKEFIMKNKEVTVGVMAVVGAAVTRVGIWLLSWYAAYAVFSWIGVV